MRDGGKHPVWNQVVELPIKNMADNLTISCFDEDLFSNDLVGKSAPIPMLQLCTKQLTSI